MITTRQRRAPRLWCQKRAHNLVEDRRMAEHFRDDERQEPDHGQPPIPSLGLRRERPKAACVGGFAADDGNERSVREQLHGADEKHQPNLARIEELLKHGQPCGLLGEERPH